MDFKFTRFVLDNDIVNVERKPLSGSRIRGTEVLLRLDSNPLMFSFSSFLDFPPSALKFALSLSGDSDTPFLLVVEGNSDGNKRPSMRNDKMFQLYHTLWLTI